MDITLFPLAIFIRYISRPPSLGVGSRSWLSRIDFQAMSIGSGMGPPLSLCLDESGFTDHPRLNTAAPCSYPNRPACSEILLNCAPQLSYIHLVLFKRQMPNTLALYEHSLCLMVEVLLMSGRLFDVHFVESYTPSLLASLQNSLSTFLPLRFT